MDGFDLLLVADKLREALGERGFTNPRVAGLLASGGTLPVGVALEVYVVPPNLPEPLTASGPWANWPGTGSRRRLASPAVGCASW